LAEPGLDTWDAVNKLLFGGLFIPVPHRIPLLASVADSESATKIPTNQKWYENTFPFLEVLDLSRLYPGSYGNVHFLFFMIAYAAAASGDVNSCPFPYQSTLKSMMQFCLFIYTHFLGKSLRLLLGYNKMNKIISTDLGSDMNLTELVYSS
jgi:hypothetical protein